MRSVGEFLISRIHDADRLATAIRRTVRSTGMLDADAPDVKAYVVLVVDDNEDVRVLLGEFLLHAFRCSIRTAEDGREAIESLRACCPLPDLIVLDWMMPNVSGADVLAAMEKDPELAQIPVVVCSAMEVKVPAYVPVVPKPVDPVEFIAVVRNLLSGGGLTVGFYTAAARPSASALEQGESPSA